jgi:predicted transposase/invertase (TIGR01784 family)
MAKSFKELTFRDRFMFGQVMSDPEICREVLETLLGEKIGKLTSIEVEKALQYSADGKPIRLDILTKDDEQDTYYDTEMQNRNHHSNEELALGKRSRYYQAIIDSVSVEEKKPYRSLSDLNVIFICTFDPFGKGRPRYTFQNRCDEDHGICLEDGVRKIFYNTTAEEDVHPEGIRSLYTYIETGTVTSQLTERIEERVKTIRSREDIEMGYWSMNAALQDERFFGEKEGLEKGREIGRKEGRKEGREEGVVLGEKKLLDLQGWLISQGRMEDVTRSINDPVYREELYREKDGQNNLR